MSVVIDGNNGVSGNNGTAATPTLRGDDPDTGIYFPSANTVAVSTGGVLRAYIDSNGLSVEGPLIDIAGTAATLRLLNNGGLSGYTFLEMTGNGAAQILVADDAFTTGQLSFALGGNVRFRMGGAGQFGVGGANYGTSGHVLTSGGSGAAASWASVGTAIAGLAYGDVGTYALLGTASNIAASTLLADSGGLVAGSQLRGFGLWQFAGTGANISSIVVSGTWRCMGYAFNPAGGSRQVGTLFLRIS